MTLSLGAIDAMKLKNPASIITKLIAAGVLIGALGRHQYDYYTLMRWVVCGVAAFAAFHAVKSNKTSWMWTLVIMVTITGLWSLTLSFGPNTAVGLPSPFKSK